MFYTFLVIVHISVCLFLILTVLLQAGKGGGMGAAFGGGGSATVFGGRGAGNFLTKLTTASAAAFMILSILLARMSVDTSAIDVNKVNAEGTTEPGAEGAEGAAGDAAKPADEAAKPAGDAAKPADEAAKPAEGAAKPADEAKPTE